MRILYGVTGCGLGHTMRARTIANHLAASGHEVKIAASGRAVGILRGHGFDVAAIDGMTMRYEAGAVRRARTVAGLVRQAPGAIRRNARAALALDFVPDAVVTDFDSFTHAIGKILDVPIISVDHQHVFDRFHHPARVVSRLSSNRAVRAFVSVKTAKCDAYVVTSFFFPPERARNTTPTFLVGPIVRPELERATPTSGEHVVVYQTTAGDPHLIDALRSSRGRFVVYGLGRSETLGNVELRAFDEAAFVRDLASARAVIANGGFTAISEAIYLGKPILSVPVRGQPEQELNAAWVDELGVGESAPYVSARAVDAFLARAPHFLKDARYTHSNGHARRVRGRVRRARREEGRVSIYDVATFEDFWPYYVRLHRRPETQWLHALATASCGALLAAGVLTRSPWLLIAAPLADYAIAQASHRLFEKNRTTPWKRQDWHARAELRMLSLVVTGRMRAEVERFA